MYKTFPPFFRISFFASAISVLFFVFLAFPSITLAQSPDVEVIESEAQKIDQMLMCPVCPAESIDQVQVEVAKQMRVKVREMLLEGRSEEQILSYFEERYGSDILAAPPVRGTMLLAWIIPIVVLGLMLSVGVWVLYNMVYKKQNVED